MNYKIDKQIYTCAISFNKIDDIFSNAIECLTQTVEMTRDEINHIKSLEPLALRKKMNYLERDIDRREEVMDFLYNKFDEEKIKEYHDKISEIDHLYREIKENQELLAVEINKAKIGTLQGLSMQKLKEVIDSGDYTMPADDERLQQIMINQQSHNERDSIGGKRRTSKNKRNKRNKTNKRK
jgi:hypothetical protein